MWVKIDDRMHNHRKTRHVLRSDGAKSRDAAPMGLWMLAASWAGQNAPDGWVPADELDRWDDDWEPLAARLVKAGYWWPEEREGEQGFGLVNWQEYNPSTGASDSGAYGNHQRWHVNRGIVSPDCPICPKEPVPDEDGSSGGIAPRFLAEIAPESEIVALPDPSPTRARPEPKELSPVADAPSKSAKVDDDFAEWYAAYPRKTARGRALTAYRTARKKTDAATLLAAIKQQSAQLMAKGPEFAPYPATWLNGERWLDEAPVSTTAPSPADDDWEEPEEDRSMYEAYDAQMRALEEAAS